MGLSELSADITQSEIRAMSVECDRVRGINLAQGVCDTELPPPVAEAAITAIRDGNNIYTRLDGIAPLRAAIARKLAHYNGLACDPDAGILVTSGATGAFHAACMALLNPGDEVLLFEPFYGYHRNTLLSMRAKAVTVLLDAPRWELDVERLKKAITPRTRAIVINTPCNPSGKVFTRAELEAIAALAEQHDLFVITDEIYEYFLCGNAKHVSFASLPGMAERTITMSGFSKTFSVTGWRLGYLAADPKWIPSIGYFHDLDVCVRAVAFAAWGGGGAAGAARRLLSRAGGGIRTEARSTGGRADSGGTDAGDSRWRILHSGRRVAVPGKTAKEKGSCGAGALRGGGCRGYRILHGGSRRRSFALLLCQAIRATDRGVPASARVVLVSASPTGW